MGFHSKIMNLPSRQIGVSLARDMDYQLGHRDARHAAAELALAADAEIERLRSALSIIKVSAGNAEFVLNMAREALTPNAAVFTTRRKATMHA